MSEHEISDFARELVMLLASRGMTLATAESCTGGLISKLITDIPGSSDVFTGGVVSYSNEVKKALLGVPEETLRQHGAVSEATALYMADGARHACMADIAVSATGIAGPGGGTPEKPVGTVWVAISCEKDRRAILLPLPYPECAGREAIRLATAEFLIRLVCETLKTQYTA